MDFDELKSAWNAGSGKTSSQDEIPMMIKENRHPVLQKIRLQLLFETIGMLLFLLVYYSMFDGEKKPAAINATLIIAVLVPVLHQIYGYYLQRNLIRGNDLSDSLLSYIRKLKLYIILSLLSRLVFMIGLSLFFGFNIQFDSFKYYCALVIVIVFCFQLVWLRHIWGKRLTQLKKTYTSFVVHDSDRQGPLF